jgi:hypothetical protein
MGLNHLAISLPLGGFRLLPGQEKQFFSPPINNIPEGEVGREIRYDEGYSREAPIR